MPESVVLCPLCLDPGPFRKMFEFQHAIRATNYLDLCLQCGAVFSNPRPTTKELEDYYTMGYRMEVCGSEDAEFSSNLPSESLRADRLVWFTQRFVPSIKRHLDIGSSTGLFLARIYEGFKCESLGVEPGDSYRKFCVGQMNNAGIPVKLYKGLEELPDEKFDFISMSHVLEHISEPLPYLDNLINHYLADNGHLLIEVPNLFGEITSLLFPHVVAYSTETLWNTLSKVGLSIVQMETSTPGLRLHIFPPPYITVLARKGLVNSPLETMWRWRIVVGQNFALDKIVKEIRANPEGFMSLKPVVSDEKLEKIENAGRAGNPTNPDGNVDGGLDVPEPPSLE